MKVFNACSFLKKISDNVNKIFLKHIKIFLYHLQIIVNDAERGREYDDFKIVFIMIDRTVT